MEWNGMEEFEGYAIWKISISFHSIACPGYNSETCMLQKINDAKTRPKILKKIKR